MNDEERRDAERLATLNNQYKSEAWFSFVEGFAAAIEAKQETYERLQIIQQDDESDKFRWCAELVAEQKRSAKLIEALRKYPEGAAYQAIAEYEANRD